MKDLQYGYHEVHIKIHEHFTKFFTVAQTFEDNK